MRTLPRPLLKNNPNIEERQIRKISLTLVALLFLVCFGVYLFNEDNESIASVESSSQKSDTAFQSVDTMELKIKTISPRLTLPGRVYPIRQADVRPQVDGIIIRRLFQEGTVVKKGQQLYQIDDARFKAVLNRSIADLKSARANLKNLETRAVRYKGLVEIEAVSQQEFDNVIAELQQARATLIPTIALPVVILGTFAVLLGFGFSINVLTMFAMVLAIGLLVDDAIVVVENVERIMHEEGLSPKAATEKSMKQITGALVGIAAVLSTVFIPMAFLSGSVGVIYRQFSITIVAAMALSVLVAMVLSPSLCATFLKASAKETKRSDKGFFSRFNRYFNVGRDAYQKSASYMSRRIIRFFVVYGLLIGGMVAIFMQLPSSFIPNEDQGLLYMTVNTPPNSTAERTFETAKKIEDYFLGEQKGLVEHLFSVVGYSFAGSAQNAAWALWL